MEQAIPLTRLARTCAMERNKIEWKRQEMINRIVEHLKDNYHAGYA